MVHSRDSLHLPLLFSLAFAGWVGISLTIAAGSIRVRRALAYQSVTSIVGGRLQIKDQRRSAYLPHSLPLTHLCISSLKR
jgi:hypothetical protein